MPIDPLTGLPTKNQSRGIVPPDPGSTLPSSGNSPFGGIGSDLLIPKTTPGINKGGFEYPDYAALLEKWLAPYSQQYAGDLAAAQAGMQADIETAQDRYQEGDTSIVAKLKKVHADNLTSIKNKLAANGLLGSGPTIQSGEKDYQDGEENLGYKQARYDAENQLLDYIKGIQRAFADFQRQQLLALQNKKGEMAGVIGDIYQPTYTAPGTSDYVNAGVGIAQNVWGKKPPGY